MTTLLPMTKPLQACLYLLALWIPLACNQPDNSPRKIELLFLGHDDTHHYSEKYAPLLASYLSHKGINLTYTSTPSSLNPENLALYDGLIIYANHDSITIDQESALLDFVKSGKGFIPIHCASYCFRNSEKYVDLVGAQFKSHETGTFTAEITQPNHPITKDLEPFETWDETYVHTLHHEDRTILMERVEGDHREPWTWTRNYGKGRIFYTAYGHDERTWNHSGFHQLIYHGILWAVGDKVKSRWNKLNMPTQVYKAADNIANYEQRPVPLPFQEPLAQPESEKLIQIPTGFELEVFATEPDIINPIAFSWDEKGRLWVIETVDYPNEVNPGNMGDDRIKICEDTDNDGRADKFTVFADSLNIPTSLVFSNGGVIVSMAPHFLFLKDTDGDDRADVKEILISGWGTFDTHAGPSNLRYGFDNQIWGTVGYSGFNGNIAGKDFEFGQGFYRFHPNGTNFEFLTRTSNNTWGLGFSETFDVFGSTANNAHSWYMGIPNRYFEGIEGIEKTGSKKIASYYPYHPITQNYRQVDVFGGFTAAAGHSLYTARSFPKEYWNRIAFVAEPTGHLLARGVLEKDGAGFVTRDGWNVLASSDEWVSPVHAEVGPDGALWIADWYNFIIQHNPTPTPERGGYQAETGRGNAHLNPLRDREHGRIYRLVYKDAPQYQRPSLRPNDPKGLIKTLKNDNLHWRLTAQRLLVERGQQDVLPPLYKLVENTSTDAIGINGGAIHALWTLHGLGALSGQNEEAMQVAYKALAHPSAGVRKAAVQVLPPSFESRNALLKSEIIHDPNPHTQLAALLALADMPSDQKAGQQLFQLSQSDEIARDLWRSQALYIAVHTHVKGFLEAYQHDPNAITYEIPTEENKSSIPSFWRKWDHPGEITADWETIRFPGKWENSELPDFDGAVALYRSFSLDQIPSSASIHLGKIGQSNFVHVNGEFVLETRNDPNMLRETEIPVNKLDRGNNYIIMRVEDRKGAGGLLGPAEEMYLMIDEQKIPLDGAWKYYVIEKYNRGINESEIRSGKELAARFAAYYDQSDKPDDDEITNTRDEDAIRVSLKVIRNQMKYDQQELVVEAGKKVIIEFENTDLLQHNLLIIQPGSLERVGKAADKLAQAVDGMGKEYIPDMPEVMYASGLLDPGKKVLLRFTAPEEPGNYPFVCTFPGHWRTMNGILKIVDRQNEAL